MLLDDLPALDGRLLPIALPTVEASLPVTLDMRAHSNVCCPDRATLLTGQYTYRHLVKSNALAKKFGPAETLAVALDRAGYRTGLVGKYLNMYGGCTRYRAWCWNVQPGWDYWFAYSYSRPIDYFDYDVRVGLPDRSTEVVQYGAEAADYSTDVFAEKAEAFIETTPEDIPLFLWFSPKAPHFVLQPAPRHESTPCDVPPWVPPNWNVVTPGQPGYLQNRRALKEPKDLTAMCRTLLAADEAFVRIRTALVRNGRWENTLVLFLSDNGMHEGQHRLRSKYAPYDARVSARISWPAKLGSEPREVLDSLSTADVAPTLCEAAGCVLRRPPHGLSVLPLLDGRAESLGRDVLYEELLIGDGNVPRWQAVVSTPSHPLGRWHYIEYGTGERELYDLTDDPWELDNKAGQPAYADVQSALAQALARESSR